MKCKTCAREYTKTEHLELPPPHHGWHPSYGDCYTCFLFSMFGGLLEPWGNKATRALQVYQITPLNVPSKCACTFSAGDLENWCEPEELAEIRKYRDDDPPRTGPYIVPEDLPF